MTAKYEPTKRTTLRRLPDRGSYDRELVHSILDEALLAHVGVTTDAGPRVLPLTYARLGEAVYVHGSVANGVLRAAVGEETCFVVTLLDGLVLARSGFHHSMNYRSVVVYARGEPVTDEDTKRQVLDAVVDRVANRASAVRPANDKELRQTLVVRLPLVEVSAKVRTGGPIDDEADLDWPVWAGVVPLTLVAGDPVPA